MTTPDLLPSLRRLVRGLTALFWGLPTTLLICVLMAMAEFPRTLGCAPPLIATGLLLLGTFELAHFQPTERTWQTAVERAQLLALAAFGLSPFVYFWSRVPSEEFYLQAVYVLAAAGLGLLLQFNHLLQRLAALLPDETLREDTRFFTRVNVTLMLLGVALLSGYLLLVRLRYLPPAVLEALEFGQVARFRFALVVVVVLLPVSVTMSLLWKARDVVLGTVFSPRA
jgi:hypothetical protein